MSPRKYDMSRRAAAAEETRRRIVEATIQVHAEQGIAGARLDDIADRAGVATGTLYRHFPSYEELVAACGALTFGLLPPPTAQTARAAFAGVRGRRRRLERLVEGLFGYYELTGQMVSLLRQDSGELRAVADALSRLEAGFGAWVDEALAPLEGVDHALVRAIVDHRTWGALIAQDVADPRAAAVELLDCATRRDALRRRQRNVASSRT
jgi:AcrR family transcriptional regulator